MDIASGDVEANIIKAETMIQQADADLYVLPEMWSTGFSVHPEDIAEEECSSKALAWMMSTAREKGCALCGSLAIRDGDSCYRNRMYFVTPDSVSHYDKRHLFSYAHEDSFYTRGEQTTVVSYRGIRFLLLVCYDLRFPVWSRWGRAGEYDAIIYVANWPMARQIAWDTLLRARAIENQCFVLGVNRVGQERNIIYEGGSVLIDPLGRAVNTNNTGENVCLVEIEKKDIETQRTAFPVLHDRD